MGAGGVGARQEPTALQRLWPQQALYCQVQASLLEEPTLSFQVYVGWKLGKTPEAEH